MIALDTNVLIYCCDGLDPGRQKVALDLMAAATDGVLRRTKIDSLEIVSPFA